MLDVTDVEALQGVFRRGRRAFLLNPPAPHNTDTDVEEHRTLSAIVRALEGSGREKVVLESTYGAQPGDRIGDLSVLFESERALRHQAIPVTVAIHQLSFGAVPTRYEATARDETHSSGHTSPAFPSPARRRA